MFTLYVFLAIAVAVSQTVPEGGTSRNSREPWPGGETEENTASWPEDDNVTSTSDTTWSLLPDHESLLFDHPVSTPNTGRSVSHSTVLQHTFDSVVDRAEQRQKILRAVQHIENRIREVEEKRDRLVNGKLRDIKEAQEKRKEKLRQIETTTKENVAKIKRNADKRLHSAGLERDDIVNSLKRMNIEVTRDQEVQQDEIDQQQGIMESDKKNIMGPLEAFVDMVKDLKPKETTLRGSAVDLINN